MSQLEYFFKQTYQALWIIMHVITQQKVLLKWIIAARNTDSESNRDFFPIFLARPPSANLFLRISVGTENQRQLWCQELPTILRSEKLPKSPPKPNRDRADIALSSWSCRRRAEARQFRHAWLPRKTRLPPVCLEIERKPSLPLLPPPFTTPHPLASKGRRDITNKRKTAF